MNRSCPVKYCRSNEYDWYCATEYHCPEVGNHNLIRCKGTGKHVYCKHCMVAAITGKKPWEK